MSLNLTDAGHFIGLAVPALVAVLLLALLVSVSAWRRGRVRLAQSEADLGYTRRLLAEMEAKYRPITDLDQAQVERRRQIDAAGRDLEQLRTDYAAKRRIYDGLIHEVRALENKIEFANLGLYEPTFELDTSSEYAGALKANRERQKKMVADGTAAFCRTQWTVDGSRRDGATMERRAVRLALRAFNNECEVTIGKVTWKNYEASRERIMKSRDAIDGLNKSNAVTISGQYLDLKLDELRLTHGERLRKREEQDRLREERVAAREEERAIREIETEIRRAEKEEAERRDAIAKVKAELEAATEAEREHLNLRIADLEQKLADAHAAKERALSMAQQTRIGHVYVISNIGSFGEGVIKVVSVRSGPPCGGWRRS